MTKKREKYPEDFDPLDAWSEFKLMIVYTERDLRSSLKGNKEAGLRARRTMRLLRKMLNDIKDCSREIEREKRKSKQDPSKSIKKLNQLKKSGKK